MCKVLVMPRLARLDAAGVLHHVIGKGIGWRNIFIGALDCNEFLSRLANCAQGPEGTKSWRLGGSCLGLQ